MSPTPLVLQRTLTATEVRAFRVSQGWNQGDLAQRLGVARVTVGRAEAGHLNPRLSVALFLLWRAVADLARAETAAGREARMPPPLPLESPDGG